MSNIVKDFLIGLCLCLGGVLYGLHPSQPAYLCGPDEDGCFSDDYASCACIPQSSTTAFQAHCLDTESIRCIPILFTKNCPSHHLFKNEHDCIATAFHSTKTTPCKLTTLSFCIEKKISVCGEHGYLQDCHLFLE